MFRYEIDENNAVLGYIEGQEEPCLYQPDYPTGKPWENREAAVAWAEAWLFHMTNPTSAGFPVE